MVLNEECLPSAPSSRCHPLKSNSFFQPYITFSCFLMCTRECFCIPCKPRSSVVCSCQHWYASGLGFHLFPTLRFEVGIRS